MASTVDLEATLKSLSIDEKIALMSGMNFWETVPFPEKGVPSLKVSDGPNGARGEAWVGGTTAACFPASTSLASTWDRKLARRTGAALAEETKTKGAYVLLGPTICPHRHPLGGRNFESFSEDPLLTGEMAAQYIHGLQENGVGATIKHYAANEQEAERFTVNATVSERALREIYLKPFEITVKKADPWCVMTSYNMLNGVHTDASDFLLQKVLREQWGFRGLVMSDWGGTNSTAETINAGQDLEMPGPGRFRRLEQVKEAIQSGATSEKIIDERCKNILELVRRAGKFENPETLSEQAVNKAEHRQLIREVGANGIVLLKNKGDLLPLTKEKYKGKKVAVLGLAQVALMHGGGSASVNVHYKVTPWEGLKQAWADEVDMQFAEGAHIFRRLPTLQSQVVDLDNAPGWSMEYYEDANLSSSPFKVEHSDDSRWMPVAEIVDLPVNSVKLIGTFTPTSTGKHYFGVSGLGPTEMFIDGKSVCQQKDNYKDFMGFLLGGGDQENFQYACEAGRSYKIEVTTLKPTSNNSGLSILDSAMGYYLGFMPQEVVEENVLSGAVELARASDAAVIFTGHTADWETEGQDQLSFNLPAHGSLDKLVTAVAKVNPNVVVVNSTGTPVALPWLDDVSAVLQAWFPGQEVGNAVADVLTGQVNPGGKLPTSFPKKLEYCPAYGNFPGEHKNGRLEVEYKEGVFIGYRHFDRVDPSQLNFPFGFGLSYTTFEVSGLSISSSDDGSTFKVSVNVKNTGSVAGSEVVQIYAGAEFATEVETPTKQLVGFTKVQLAPGQSESAEVEFEAKQLAYFEETKSEWVVEKGQYSVFVGTSATDIREKGTVAAQKRMTFSA